MSNTQPGRGAWLRRVSSEPKPAWRMYDLAEVIAASASDRFDFDKLAGRLGMGDRELFDALTSLEARRLITITPDGRIRRARGRWRWPDMPQAATRRHTARRGNRVDANHRTHRTN